MELGSLKMALGEILLLDLFSAMSRDSGSQSHFETQQPTTALILNFSTLRSEYMSILYKLPSFECSVRVEQTHQDRAFVFSSFY